MILKIGGSVLTHKENRESVDFDSFEKAMNVVSKNVPTVLVHGAGSFGHHHAHEYNINNKNKKTSSRGIYETHKSVCKLNQKVVEELLERNVDCVPVHVISCCLEDVIKNINSIIRGEFLPVVHGDVKINSDGSVSIISGDKIAVELGKYLNKRVGFCTSIGGILDKEGKKMTKISSIEEFQAIGSNLKDVTGGMKGKVKTLLNLNQEGYIFGLEELDDFLKRKEVGTKVN